MYPRAKSAIYWQCCSVIDWAMNEIKSSCGKMESEKCQGVLSGSKLIYASHNNEDLKMRS